MINHIDAALDLLPPGMGYNRNRVLVMMLAIQLMEAPYQERRQIGGPAVGRWQFERGGGIVGVLRHRNTSAAAVVLCDALGVAATPDAVYDAMPQGDILDAGFARLLLWTDPLALPDVGDVSGAMAYYHRNWRPGAWTRGNAAQRRALAQRWAVRYATAMDLL